MNPLPKPNIPSPDSEDEEDLWKDLPEPGSGDPEEEWVGGPNGNVLGSRSAGPSDKDAGNKPMIQMGVREWDYSPSDEQADENSPGLPEARLSIEELRVEVSPDADRASILSAIGTGGWVAIGGIVVIAVLVGTLIWVTVLNESNPKVNPLGIQPLVIEREEEYPRGELIADLLLRQEEAGELFRKFVQAQSPDEVLAMVRRRPGVEALVAAAAGKPANVPKSWTLPADVRWEVHTDVDPVFGVLSGYFPDGVRFHAFMVLDNGKLLLDWEATMCHGTVPFSQLVDGKGDAPKVRVLVRPALFHTVTYPESEYRSFQILTDLDDPPVWAFARRGTLPERTLAEVFHESMFGGDVTKEAMIFLSLDRGDPGSAPNQWLITDVLHKSWVVP